MQTKIRAALPDCLTETHLSEGKKFRGKVRDIYDQGDQLVMITTDRLSAFDRELAAIPFKGQVLNLTSAFWFDNTKDIVPNHVLSIPDANTTIAKKCRVFPVEFVVRGYITGTTNTSLWTQYQKDVRHYCGLDFPEGLKKNQRLNAPVLTPTTKDAVHDRPISPEEIVREGFMSADEWAKASDIALKLYERGVAVAASRGLILVDTKYEMGLDAEGQITLIDEVHTPDSSRYWLADSYAARFAAGEEPESIDKEFLRRWFAANCDPYEEKMLPEAREELVVDLSAREIRVDEMFWGKGFQF
jgi:phosphoribosylaminoimidazole-succinocarboxamide synthase